MSENINHSRRNILSYFSRTAKNIQELQEATPRGAPRPPQAVDEVLFLHFCDGCGKCQQICPNGIIEIRDGCAKVNLDYNECSLCGACTQTCPSGALQASVMMNLGLRPSFSHVCNNYQGIDCFQCQLGCTKLAITIEEGELPILDVASCNGCGQCQKSCYMGAISMKFIENS